MWNIIHDAKRTEHIIAFLEEALSGVRFLAHYQVPTAITEDDDADLLEVMRRLVIHPLCEETDDDIPPGSDFGEGGGAEVGPGVAAGAPAFFPEGVPQPEFLASGGPLGVAARAQPTSM